MREGATAAIASLLSGKIMLLPQAPCSGTRVNLYRQPPYCDHRSLGLSLPANWASYPMHRKPLDSPGMSMFCVKTI